MNQDEYKAKMAEELEISGLQTQNENAQIVKQQNLIGLQEQEKGLIKEQLSLDEEIDRIQNLLRGRVLVRDEYGQKFWKDPPSEDDVLLTEAGIQLVLNAINWYINKNTLLSNYDEKTILQKMEDFGTTLADALFMSYEKYFVFPSPKTCQEFLIKRIDNRVTSQIFDAQLRGKEYNREEIYQRVVSQMDLAKEREKIREQLMKNKLKGFELLLREVIDAVHSTYNRAYMGQERRTLRQHIHISETKGGIPQENQQRTNPFGWIKPGR